MAEVIVIEPGRYERNYWCDLWRYRELFRVLAWRDLAVRYKQTVIGIAWTVIRPFLTMLMLLISGRAIRWNSSCENLGSHCPTPLGSGTGGVARITPSASAGNFRPGVGGR